MSKFLTLILINLFAFVSAQASPQDVHVDLQWETLPGAHSYFLEAQDMQGKVVRTVKSPTAHIQFSILPGAYKIKCRAFDSRGVPGKWSPEQALEVAPPAPHVTSTPQSVAADALHQEATVPLQWKPVSSAEEYEIQIKNQNGAVKTLHTKDPHLDLKLVPGSYQYRIISKANGQSSTPPAWSSPLLVKATTLPPPTIPEFTEDSPPDFISLDSQDPHTTIEVTVEKRRHLSTEWKSLNEKQIQIKDSRLDLTHWEPGLYRLRFWRAHAGAPSSAKVERYFIAKPTEQNLQEKLKEAEKEFSQEN